MRNSAPDVSGKPKTISPVTSRSGIDSSGERFSARQLIAWYAGYLRRRTLDLNRLCRRSSEFEGLAGDRFEEGEWSAEILEEAEAATDYYAAERRGHIEHCRMFMAFAHGYLVTKVTAYDEEW